MEQRLLRKCTIAIEIQARYVITNRNRAYGLHTRVAVTELKKEINAFSERKEVII